jgi:UDP-GlcNAc:undecaprenyl-phosphate GlcNAc-1-phosphate transferase
MSVALTSILALLVAAATASAMVPAICAVAVTRKLLDYPDGDRHHHPSPVPRLGGVAVFGGLLAGVAVSAVLASFGQVDARAEFTFFAALVAAGAILFGIGLLDDLRGVSPALKIIGQTAAASIVIAYGFQIDRLSIIPGHEFSLGPLSIPVTILWLVGVSNAFNLVDGLDGLAAGVGMIALVAISAAAAILGQFAVPIEAAALTGALLGFLRHNWHPARIFLGDSGSLVVGFFLAVFAVRGSTTSSGTLLGLIPIFALSYLLLDTGISMLRRWLRGSPLSRADGRHIHHQLLALGLTPRRAVTVLYAKAATIAVLGLGVTFVPPGVTLAITAVAVVLVLVILIYGVRWLEYDEILEAGASFASGMRKARGAIQDRIVARDVARLLRDAKTADEIQAVVRGHAEAFRFVHMEILQENAPSSGMVRAPDHIGSATWLLEYPLLFTDTGPRNPEIVPVLAIWCSVSANGRPTNAERVAGILAPAISAALERVGALVTAEPAAEPRRARASGSFLSPRRSGTEHRRISDSGPNS